MERTIPPRIALDFDNTLAETQGFLRTLHRAHTGEAIELGDLVTYDTLVHRMGKARFWALFAAMNSTDETNLRAAIHPADGAWDALYCVVAEWGPTIHVLTGNPPSSNLSVERWLAGFSFPSFPVRFGAGTGEASTCEVKLSRGYSIYIDDHPDMARLAASHPEKQVILRARPWNTEAATGPLPANVTRAESWGDIHIILDRALEAMYA